MRINHVQIAKGHPDARRPDYWTDQALCGAAPERDKQAFTGSYPTREIARDLNRRFCSKCPVRNECLTWALEDWAFTGIAGGAGFIGEKAAGRPRRMIPIITMES